MSNRISQTGLLSSLGIAFALFVTSSCTGISGSGAGETTIQIEVESHHLGNDTGNEGTVFEEEFIVDMAFSRATLEFDFVPPSGPNLKTPPIVSINGTDAGSVRPFFPPLDTSDLRWQTNPDGDHDYNGVIHVSLPVTHLLFVGTNTLRIENGRFDDDYWFANVQLVVAGNTALEKTGPPSEQTPDKQLSYTFAELRIEFPSSSWELIGGSEAEKSISFVRRYKIGFGNHFGILLVDVFPMARGYSREKHIKEYFNYERWKSRPQHMEWSGFVEGTMEIDGVHYPIMRYSISNKTYGSKTDGLFMILFPDDLEKRHRFYVLMLGEGYPEGKPAPGFPDLEFIVKNLEILPVLVSSETLAELGHFDFDNRLYIYETMDEMVNRLYKTPYNAIVKSTTIEREGVFSTLVLRDRDGDGQPDQFIYLPEGESDSMDFGFLFDLNKDGRADYLVFNGGPMGTEEGKSFWMNYHWIDSNYDGRVDILVNNACTLDDEEKHPQKGLTAWMYDSDFDGSIDKAEYLSAGFVKPVPEKDGVLVVNCVLQDQKIVIGENEWFKNFSSEVLRDINAILQ